MNFLGMGTLEIIIVLLIAFIFLGPERMVDAARKLGKFVAEMRRMAADLPQITLDEEEPRPPAAPIVHRDGSPAARPSENKSQESTSQIEDETPQEVDGPVAHQRVSRPKIADGAESPAAQDQRRANE